MRAGAAVLAAAAALLPAREPITLDLRRPATEGALRLVTRIDGGDALGWAGFAMASGDLNGDGLGDLVIGAPGGTDDRPSRRGRVSVILGRLSLPSVIDLKVRSTVSVVPTATPVLFSDADIVLEGESDFDHFGRALVVADFDGDGFADLAAGSPRADGPLDSRADCGEVLILHGAAMLPPRIDLAHPAPGVRVSRVYGPSKGAGLGAILASGDLNGDGRPDLLAGMPQARGAAEATAPLDTGAVAVIEPARFADGILDLGRSGAAGLLVWLSGASAGELAGASLAAGDFDGDGMMDLAVGARGADPPEGRRPDAGAVYLLLGPLGAGSSGPLDRRSDAIFLGERTGDNAGSSLRLGDLDGDGYEELLIGVEMADGHRGERLDAGGVRIVRGQSAPSIEALRVIDLPVGGRSAAVSSGPVRLDFNRPGTTTGTIHGADPGDHLGVREVVDLDGDGRSEVLVGAEDSSSRRNSRAGGGEVWLLSGGEQARRATLWGAVGGTHLGRSVISVDLNGDGARELAVSAPQAGQSLEGRIYVLSGNWGALMAPDPRR